MRRAADVRRRGRAGPVRRRCIFAVSGGPDGLAPSLHRRAPTPSRGDWQETDESASADNDSGSFASPTTKRCTYVLTDSTARFIFRGVSGDVPRRDGEKTQMYVVAG